MSAKSGSRSLSLIAAALATVFSLGASSASEDFPVGSHRPLDKGASALKAAGWVPLMTLMRHDASRLVILGRPGTDKWMLTQVTGENLTIRDRGRALTLNPPGDHILDTADAAATAAEEPAKTCVTPFHARHTLRRYNIGTSPVMEGVSEAAGGGKISVMVSITDDSQLWTATRTGADGLVCPVHFGDGYHLSEKHPGQATRHLKYL